MLGITVSPSHSYLCHNKIRDERRAFKSLFFKMVRIRYAVALLAHCVFASSASASNLCGKQPTKAQVEQCYQSSISERKEALEEFHEAILASTNIPQEVKLQVSRDYKSFIKNIFNFCPDSACVDAAMMEQIKDMYQETSKYTTRITH